MLVCDSLPKPIAHCPREKNIEKSTTGHYDDGDVEKMVNGLMVGWCRSSQVFFIVGNDSNKMRENGGYEKRCIMMRNDAHYANGYNFSGHRCSLLLRYIVQC